jgi:recombination protein RecA
MRSATTVPTSRSRRFRPGHLALDAALGIGGVPRGRIVEIYGPESRGKTTSGPSDSRRSPGLGGIVAFIDAEHALDPVYAARIGVDIDEVLISQPDTGEQALEICDMLVRSGAIDVVVVDSVARSCPAPKSKARSATRRSACRPAS